jgi:tRNA (mo5U34)-methyltransferase
MAPLITDTLSPAALAERAREFDRKLIEVRAAIDPRFLWYPYHSLATFALLVPVLEKAQTTVAELAASESIVDIGCADGDCGFFLESLGHSVVAVDNPGTSHSALRGFRLLRERLGSAIELVEADVDEDLRLPAGRTFGLTLLLGILYHLKNPFRILEQLSRRTRYCLLSTRVIDRLPSGMAVGDQPIAYLLGSTELNQDHTNFWLFSEPGANRLFERTGWELVASNIPEATSTDNLGPDLRLFCLLRSIHCGAPLKVTLGRGWHHLEDHRFRWTEARFEARLESVDGSPVTAEELRLSFYLPPVIAELGPVTLSATVNGLALPPVTYRDPGGRIYAQPLPPALGKASRFEVGFATDRFLPPGAVDQRERALVISGFDQDGVPAGGAFHLMLR